MSTNTNKILGQDKIMIDISIPNFTSVSSLPDTHSEEIVSSNMQHNVQHNQHLQESIKKMNEQCTTHHDQKSVSFDNILCLLGNFGTKISFK